MQEFFDDVLIYASRSMPVDLVDELVPWDLPELADFRDEYLSGFQAERYTVTPTSLRRGPPADGGPDSRPGPARHRRRPPADSTTVQTQHVGVTFKHVLLPCWLATYRFHERTYRILVNARTGEVIGKRPWSWIKISLFVLMILIAVGGLVALFNR